MSMIIEDEDLIQVSEFEYIADATLELSIFEEKFKKNFNTLMLRLWLVCLLINLAICPRSEIRLNLII